MSVIGVIPSDHSASMGDYPDPIRDSTITTGDRVEFRTTIVGSKEVTWLPGIVDDIDYRTSGRPVAYWIKAGRIVYRVNPQRIRLATCPN